MGQQSAVTGSSEQVGTGPIASHTAVVAPKSYRQALQQMLQGWQALFPGDSPLPSSVGDLTQATILARLQQYIEPFEDLDTHSMALARARGQVRAQEEEAQAYLAVLKAAAINYFGAANPQLAKFGMKVPKARTPLTSQQASIRAAKVIATRKLRGTLGSVQKAKIKAGPMTFVEPVAAAGKQPDAAAFVAGSTPPLAAES